MDKVYFEITDQDQIDLLWHILVFAVDEVDMDVDDSLIVNDWISRLEGMGGGVLNEKFSNAFCKRLAQVRMRRGKSDELSVYFFRL